MIAPRERERERERERDNQLTQNDLPKKRFSPSRENPFPPLYFFSMVQMKCGCSRHKAKEEKADMKVFSFFSKGADIRSENLKRAATSQTGDLRVVRIEEVKRGGLYHKHSSKWRLPRLSL